MKDFSLSICVLVFIIIIFIFFRTPLFLTDAVISQAQEASNPSVLHHYCFAESFVTTKNSFGLHLVNDICYDLNGSDIKWAASS